MNKTSAEKDAVLNVFAQCVGPLIRLAFEYGIQASEISAVIRRVYIQALEARLKGQNWPVTEARLAVVSGLPRSDVTALRAGLLSGGTNSKTAIDQLQAVLTTWHTQPYSGVYG